MTLSQVVAQTVRMSRPLLRSFALVMAEAATSQRTSAVPAKAPGSARNYLSAGFARRLDGWRGRGEAGSWVLRVQG